MREIASILLITDDPIKGNGACFFVRKPEEKRLLRKVRCTGEVSIKVDSKIDYI
jgi:hypothetical protein